MFMLREYESNGFYVNVRRFRLVWRLINIPSELFSDSNADDAQIASIVLSKGKRVIQDPDAKFTDFAQLILPTLKKREEVKD